MRRLLTYVWPYRGPVVAALVCLAVFRIASLVPAYLMKEAVDRFMMAGDLAREARIDGIRMLAAIFLGVILLKECAAYANTILMASIGQRVMRDLRVAVFSHLQRMSMDFFSKNPVGRLMTRVTGDIETLNEMLSAGVVALLGDVVSLIAVLGLMLALDAPMTAVTLVVLPALYFVSKAFRRLARPVYKEIRKKVAAMNAYLQENISGMRVVQLFRREGENRRRFDAMNRDLFGSYLKSTLYASIFFPCVNVVGATAKALAIWFGGGEIIQQNIQLGTLIAFITYIDAIFQPLAELAEKYNMIQSAMASSERVFGLLDTAPSVLVAPKPVPVEPFQGRIEFRSVWFSYEPQGQREESAATKPCAVGPPAAQAGEATPHAQPGPASPAVTGETAEPHRAPPPVIPAQAGIQTPSTGTDGTPVLHSPQWVLKDLSFTIEPGEKIALVGATGAGKSSIINLVCRFYDATRGSVLIDGKDIRELDLAELRSKMAVVLQDVFLFSGDIDHNIRLGKESISRAKVEEAARMVNAHLFVEKLEGGYGAEVKERGATLSIGQRQLLSFARALAYDPRLIILDEATSSVDTETELLIQDALKKLLSGRTAIIVAHRLSTIQSSDRIFVMHHGELCEVGNHAELLAKRGIYYRLYRLQYEQPAAGAKD
ncbi:MAG: ABC transporter transmembrane domain-containing protein [Planctomycetota bacterium]|nr:ABC transporter transmembrane domain-containing protein [Planctomycetota bacterium]